ncbi:hypothetical protein IAT40_002708 [Kwoniella sp. CBS 6097]
MPSSPPLSPSPRRWRGTSEQPHPAFAALLSSFETTSTSGHSDRSAPDWATARGQTDDERSTGNGNGNDRRVDEDDEAEVEFLTATQSPDQLRTNIGSQAGSRTPEIRTTSPSPQRPVPSFSSVRSSPLLPPNRGQLFGEDTSATIGRSGLGPRGILSNDTFRPQPFDPSLVFNPIPPQATGQSIATIDAAYDGVLSQLDALANPSHLPINPSSSNVDEGINRYIPPPAFQPLPIRQPLVGLGIRFGDSPTTRDPPSSPVGGMGDFTISRLSTVTERTERSSTANSPTSSHGQGHERSPTFPGAYKEGPSSSTIASKYPLPSSPVKGPRSAFSAVGPSSPSGTPQGTPKKTSDLIKMFESRGTGPVPLPQPQFTPSSPTKEGRTTGTSTPARPSPASRIPPPTMETPSTTTAIAHAASEPFFNPPPPSSFRGVTGPTPPPKSASPLSQVRGMIASWRARSGSPALGNVASPGKGGDGPGLFRSGDKGWNVSIRRRRRHERELAERAPDSQEQPRDQGESERIEAERTPSLRITGDGEDEKDYEKGGDDQPSRSASIRSDKKTASEPKQLTGDPIRTGGLYYLNVHDEDRKPNYQWVRADGRLYPEGLELTWVSDKGRATVTLDLEFCDEVASTYSPNNPMAGDDIGALAAKRQGELADTLYPFKLVYDDGVERLACDSARDRVRWVNAIWTVLERTRVAPSASLRANRSSSDHGSEAGGSASTHFTPAEGHQPLPSPNMSGSHPLYTTDDAVIETSGGLHAPIIQRGSRRLAAGGLERTRSLRRVASEADLTESTSAPPLPEKDVPSSSTTTAIQDIPLTAQTAERPLSRDFTFAHGIKPPTLMSETFFSPSEGLSTFQTPSTNYQSLAESSQQFSAAPSSCATATPGPSSQPLESPSGYTTARSEIAPTPATTAQPLSVMSAHTVPSNSQSASTPFQSATKTSSGQSMYTALTPATTSRGLTTDPAYTAQPGSFTPAATVRDLPSSPSAYTAQLGSQTPMTTAREFSDRPSTTTAPAGSFTPQGTAQPWTSITSAQTARGPPTEMGTAEIFSPSASSHTARPDTHTPAATARGFSSNSSHTAGAAPATETPMGTTQPLSSTMTAHTPFALDTPAGTAHQFTASTSVHTPRGPSPAGTARSAPFTPESGVPHLAITGASPSDPTEGYGTAQGTVTTGLTAPSHALATATTGTVSQPYGTAGTSAYTGASGLLGSPFHTPPPPADRASSRMSRSSVSTYHSAPPPVPSRDSHYSTASAGKSSTKAPSTASTPSSSSGTKYQLHDAPVPSPSSTAREASPFPTATEGDPSYFTARRPNTNYGTADDAHPGASDYYDRPPTTRYATSTTHRPWTGSMGTAPTSPSRSPRSSEWNTALPPPISRTASSDAPSSDRLTDGLGTRRGSRAWTQVSYPDSDDELLADLERRSSDGSSVSRRTKSKYTAAPTPSRTMFTAQTGGERSGRTPLGTAVENTFYTNARQTAYTTAPSWHTQSTHYATVPPTQSFYTARTSQTAPIRAEQPPPLPSAAPTEREASSTAVPSNSENRIPRIPPPVIPVHPPRVPTTLEPTPVMPVRLLPPPSPSFPSSVPGSSSASSTISESTVTAPREVATGSDVNRLLNFLQGQEQARQGQNTRLGNQLDRIERRVGQIAENQVAMADRDRPPPPPSKDDDESPPPSPTSSITSASSTETARPVTPPPAIIPEVINQQFDDLRNLLGTLIGRQEDLLGRQDELAQEMARRRNFDVELPDRGPGMARLEDLLKRVLQRVGDSEFADELLQSQYDKKPVYPASHVSTPRSQLTKEGSMYEGGDSVYSGEFDVRGKRAPPNSIASSYDRRRRGPLSELPESEIPSPEFDEAFALAGLPPDTPPDEYITQQRDMPPHLARRMPRQTPGPAPQPQIVPQPMPIQEESPEEVEYYDEQPEYEPEPEPEYEPEPEPEYEPEPEAVTEYEPTPPPAPRELTPQPTPVQPPIPYRTEESYPDEDGPYDADAAHRGPYRQGPPPQPVDLPTPVNSPRNMPPYQPQQPGMRPGFAPAPGMPAPMPPGPGMTDMPRPSLPRIAGVRDPISTTYFRRGFPPGPMGPMGPMGMFPGPMGIPGPGMGPFMPGLRPGMPGFGGPIGPNVNPSLRRAGFFPPGVTSTTGDYGLPAAARYGNAGLPPSGPTAPGMPPRPPSGHTTTADTGLGNTTTESTVSTPATSTPSTLTEQIVTPVAPTTVLQEPIHMPTTADLPPIPLSASAVPTDDSFRRALGNTKALAAAQGEQQNEMSRYLHGMSDQIADGTLATQNQLAEILGDIATLREQLKPKHIHARVLPDGTVMLDNGDILDGIRGAPAPVPPGVPAPPPPPPTASHVEGKILPNGTVMAGGKIVDGIKGAPSVAAPPTPMTILDEAVEEEQVKNAEQDQKLAELQGKIEELMQRTMPQQPPERIFEEEEVISARADTSSPAPAITPGFPPTMQGTPAPTPGLPPTVMGTPAPTMGVAPTAVGPHTDIRREKQIIKEREVIREGPINRHKEVTIEDELTRDMVTEVPPGTLPPGTMAGTIPSISVVPPTVVGTPGPGSGDLADAPATVVAAGSGTSAAPPPSTVPLPIAVPTAEPTAASTAPPPTTAPPPAPTSSRVNPRTGKPLTLPPPLSTHSMSPIQTDYNYAAQPTNHLIREEHEEIIQRPDGGPPVHTHTTTRTYTQLPPGTAAPGTVPAGTLPPATEMGNIAPAPGSFGPPASVHPSAAGPAPKTVGPSASVHPSAGKAATTAPPPATVFPDAAGAPAMPTIAPGAHTSDHQSVVQQPLANIPAVKSSHEAEVVAPGPVPIDSRNASTSHTVQPAKTVADPSGVAPPGPGAPTIVPAPAPATAAPVPVSNVPSAKPPAAAWDTNHPKSPKPSQAPSVAANVPTDGGKGAAGPPPATTVANVPTAPVGDAVPPSGSVANVAPMAEMPPMAPSGGAVAGPPPSLPADAGAAPSKSPSSKGKNGVHWDSMIPNKEVSGPPPKSPKTKTSTVGDAPGSAPASVPSAGGFPPATDLHNVPLITDPNEAIVIPPEAQPASKPAPIPASTDTKIKETKSSPGSGILKKPKSNESLKTTTPPPAGVPIVPSDTRSHPDHATVGQPIPTVGSDKATRVADTAHVSRPPTMEELLAEGRDVFVQPPGETIHVPSAGPPAKSGSNKLKKPVPTFIEGDTSDPKNVISHLPTGSTAGPPSRAGTPAPPSRAGTPDPGAAHTGPASTKGATPADIPVLEPVILPDGRTAYIPSRPVSQANVSPAGVMPDMAGGAPPPPGARPPSTLKKGKSPTAGGADGVNETTVKEKEKTKSHVPAESELGGGHCSVCCPHGPRTHGGVPIEPCEHQDGILGPMAKAPSGPAGPRSNKSAKGGKPPSAHSLGLPAGAEPSGPGDEVNIDQVEGDVVMGDQAKSGPPSKLTKGKKTGSLSPEEEAMEDARKLAVRQKAAAEQAAAEKADKDARDAERAAKARLAEDRHKENAEALAAVLKALDALAAENKATKTMSDEKAKAQDKRRTDKTVRDKKITEALDKLVADREEAKKKQAVDDKKPGTQAILDALKTAGDGQAAFLRKLATEIMDQNSNQHQLTQQAAKGAAREQIGFNLAGYLDDFSKALSGEVRVLLKEVGDLRESRRALYMELAELLLMKGRQSAGDLMAILPYPAAPPKNPANQPKKEEKKDNQPKQPNQPKAPAGIPAWASWQPMGIPPVMGRPLPQPGGPPPMPMNLGGGAVPPPPPPHGRPLPQV